MDPIVIKEDNQKIKYIKLAIKALPKDANGYVDCMNVGKYLHKKNVQIVGKITSIITKYEDLFDSKILQKGEGTIRVVRLKTTSVQQIEYLKTDEVKKLVEDWKIGNNSITGQYYFNKDTNHYGFRYIATKTFNELTYLDGTDVEIVLVEPVSQLTLNEFYEFRWRIVESDDERGYKMALPENPMFQSIKPKELVDRLYAVWANCDPTISNQMKNTMKMVSTQLTASSDGTFIYELLQNANDYPIEDADGNVTPVDVEFHITSDYLIYRHSGDFFSPRNIAAISKLAAGEKKAVKNAIGYKGIGFKTIFNGNDYAYLRTGDYSLRFDESSRVSRDDPWQIMPIWTDSRTIDPKVKQLFEKGKDRFRVQMAIRPKDSSMLRGEDKRAYNNLFLDIFKDEKDILFVPNLHSVQIFIDGLPKKKCTKKSGSWVLTHEPYKYVFSKKEIEEINAEVLASDGKIPDKYKDFGDTRVMFACRRNGKTLLPVENATVNCYLPTLAQFGFPFMFNTDMIPTGPRDNIELKIDLNKRFAKIAGLKFVEWLSDLVKSGEYSYKSIFNLIPDFVYCREHHHDYADFITAFEEGYRDALHRIPVVPVIKDEEITVQLLSDVIYDDSGITYSSVMTDDEFKSFYDKDCYLVVKDLRYYDDAPDINKFKHLHEEYRSSDKTFTEDNLIAFCDNKDFLTWLIDKGNNNRFINFVYQKRLLKSVANKPIFHNEDDESKLFPAKDLYYDVSSFRQVLPEYIEHLNCLCTQTKNIIDRELFLITEKSSSFFKEFSPSAFLDTVVFAEDNKASAIEQLSPKERSIAFIRLLASYNLNSSKYKFLPFYNYQGIMMNDYCRDVFFYSEEAFLILESSWFEKSLACLLSIDYFSEDEEFNESISKVLKQMGVRDYSAKSFINDILLKDSNEPILSSSAQKSLETSLSFVSYLYKNKQHIEDGKLACFPLSVQDAKGNKTWHKGNEEEKNFFYSDSFNEHALKAWIGQDMMYSINESYISSLIDPNSDLQVEEQKKDITKFYQDKCDIKKFGQANFYHFVLSKKTDKIFAKLTSEDSILDFYRYLTDNFEILFEGTGNIRGEKTFADMPFLNDNNIPTTLNNASVVKFRYSESLATILQESWLPSNLVVTASPKYEKIGNAVLSKLGFLEYSMTAFFNSVIWDNRTSIINNVNSFKENVDFHKFMILHRKEIAEAELQTKLPNFPVFVSTSSETPTISLNSNGHKICSPDILKFVENKIVSMEDIDVIDNEYMISGAVDYWGTILKNASFDHSYIKTWLTTTIFSKIYPNIIVKANNLTLWKTIKEVFSKDEDIKSFGVFPVLAHNQVENASNLWLIPNQNAKLYISDAYRTAKGTDGQLKEYDPVSSYLIDDFYLESNSTSASGWFDFWKKIGLKYDITEILISSVLDKITTLKKFDLPGVLLANRDSLKKAGYDIDKFTGLNIKTKAGSYLPISTVRVIKNTEPEPLPQIALPKQVSDEYSSEVKQFILEIAEKAKSLCVITTADEWARRKIVHIKNSQNELNSTDESARSLAREYYSLAINEVLKYCSSLFASSQLQSKSYATELKELKLLGQDGNYHLGKELTFGSAYLPKTSSTGICDFQGNGIKDGYKSMKYISDTYKSLENWESVRGILAVYMQVECVFKKEHIQYLDNHQFALYFWSTYVGASDKNREVVNKLIADKNINSSTVCVPTATSVKMASEIYSRKEIGNLVKRLPEIWPNLICSDVIPLKFGDSTNPIDSIEGYKTELSAKHCLMYLGNSDPSHYAHRRNVLSWLLKDSQSISDDDIMGYRNSDVSIWLNCEKSKTPLRDMCVISPEDQYVQQYFGYDPHILPESYLPENKVEDICKLLHIDVLTKDNSFNVTPIDSTIEDQKCKTVMAGKCLLLASIIGKQECEDWKEAYKSYLSLLEQLSFICCSSIELTCKVMPVIKNDDAVMFFVDKDKNTFYYVEKWQGKVFYDDFVRACITSLDVPTDADTTLIGNILDEDLSVTTLSKYVNRYCFELLDNEEFCDELFSVYPFLRGKLENRKGVIEEDVDDIPAETTITTKIYEGSEENSDLNGTGNPTDISDFDTSSLDASDSDNGHDANATQDANPSSSDNTGQQTSSQTEGSEIDNEDAETTDTDQRTGTNTGSTASGQKIDTTSGQQTYTSGNGSNTNWQQPNTSSNGSTSTESERQSPNVTPMEELKRRTRRPQNSVFGDEDSVAEKYKPSGAPVDLTGWKKERKQIELGVADPNDAELEACRSFIDGSKSDKEIIDEQYLSRYRLYNYLTSVENEELGDKREFINNKSHSAMDIKTDNGYIHARSAKGGILFVSSFLWEKLSEEGHRLCMYYGNKGSEFKMIDDTQQLIELVGDDNIIVQVKGKEKHETIKSIFTGTLKDRGRAYVLIRIKSNERYNALFVNIYNNDDDNDVEF